MQVAKPIKKNKKKNDAPRKVDLFLFIIIFYNLCVQDPYKNTPQDPSMKALLTLW